MLKLNTEIHNVSRTLFTLIKTHEVKVSCIKKKKIDETNLFKLCTLF